MHPLCFSNFGINICLVGRIFLCETEKEWMDTQKIIVVFVMQYNFY